MKTWRKIVLRALHAQEADILKLKLQFRYISSKQYQIWIWYEKDGFDPIKGYRCQCKTGTRTVGCCTHIACVLWYLEYYRYIHLNTTVILIQNMKWMQLFDSKDESEDEE